MKEIILDGQTLLEMSQSEFLQDDIFDDLKIEKEKARDFYLSLKPYLMEINLPKEFSFGIGRIFKDRDPVFVYVLFETDNRKYRCEMEQFICMGSKTTVIHAHPLESSLFIGLERKQEIWQEHYNASYVLKCPNCDADLRRRSIWSSAAPANLKSSLDKRIL